MTASTPPRRRRLRPVRFWQDEAGAGSAFGLFGILICLMFAGVSIDFTNAWRHREILRLSADVAAHAGASALAEAGGRMTALAVATGATELNTPTRSYGRTILDPFEDIQALQYDPGTNMVGPGDMPNAVSVHLQRSARVQNPVPTFLLQLIGQNSWDISITSVAAVVPTERCVTGDGLYSHDRVVLGGQVSVGEAVCLHGQRSVDVPGQSSFDKGAGVSMPDMADCQGGCSDMSSGGFAAASAEVNLVMTRPADLIERLAEGFSDPKVDLPEEEAFFDRHPLAEDLSALDELGVDTQNLKTGDVVGLKTEQLDRARGLPAGLVYLVDCTGKGESNDVLSLGGTPMDAEMAAELSQSLQDTSFDEAGSGEEPPFEELIAPNDVEVTQAQMLKGLVLITECRLHFTALADIQGALILSTRAVSDVALSAEPGARAGDPKGRCDGGMHSVFMARGEMQVPASFTASNAAFVIDGTIAVVGEPRGGVARHSGLALHASGLVEMAGKHDFTACGTAATDLLPALNVIKFVIPTDPLVSAG
jgi:hypothetical protein